MKIHLTRAVQLYTPKLWHALGSFSREGRGELPPKYSVGISLPQQENAHSVQEQYILLVQEEGFRLVQAEDHLVQEEDVLLVEEYVLGIQEKRNLLAQVEQRKACHTNKTCSPCNLFAVREGQSAENGRSSDSDYSRGPT